jgi:methylmalonyl-CoA carboxyltransferase 12S subunit
MTEKTRQSQKKAGDLAGVLARIGELEARVARLEAAQGAAAGSQAVPHAAPRPARAVPEVPAAPHEEVPEEVLMVIAATVAAYLGERAHVRQVRLVASEAWAQQGRVGVMASHRWAVQR